tara:strand:+ start:19696 stop:20142 length:447 start_codon:yes stop_codon:yes gene_type:complete
LSEHWLYAIGKERKRMTNRIGDRLAFVPYSKKGDKMPTPFMCHDCDTPTMNKDGICDDCEKIKFYYTDNWFIADKAGSKGFDGTKGDAKRADEKIKFCKQCKLCWEHDYNASKTSNNRLLNRLVYIYYEDFPTYGKIEETCPRCIKKK